MYPDLISSPPNQCNFSGKIQALENGIKNLTKVYKILRQQSTKFLEENSASLDGLGKGIDQPIYVIFSLRPTQKWRVVHLVYKLDFFSFFPL